MSSEQTLPPPCSIRFATLRQYELGLELGLGLGLVYVPNLPNTYLLTMVF